MEAGPAGPTEPADRICPSCGAGNLETSVRCYACGRDLPRVGDWTAGFGEDVDASLAGETPGLVARFDSWRATRATFGWLRQNLSLLEYPAVAALVSAALLAAGFGIGLFVLAPSTPGGLDEKLLELVGVAIAEYYSVGVANVFALGAFVAHATDRMSTERWSATPASRRGELRRFAWVRWAFTRLTAGTVLWVYDGLVGMVWYRYQWFRAGPVPRYDQPSSAWRIFTFLVPPVLLFEDLGYRASLIRSEQLFRRRFGLTLIQNSVFDWTLLAASLAGSAIFLWSVVTDPFAPGVRWAVYGLLSSSVVYVAVLAEQVDRAIVQTVLYRFATSGRILPEFARRLGPLTGPRADRPTAGGTPSDEV
ncbi:MAG TPA: hypothetical protein VML53_02345 [Thermoplasmata archaeon]|nr:hypothetical protein [Thermoplasmata archaeon]